MQMSFHYAILFQYFDGITTGPYCFSRAVVKLLNGCEKLQIVDSSNWNKCYENGLFQCGILLE
jgi:hypothetical protein